MSKFFSTDKIIAIGLVVSLIVSFFVNSSVELQGTIAGGLVGYLGKVVNNVDTDTIKRLVADEIAGKLVNAVSKKGKESGGQ